MGISLLDPSVSSAWYARPSAERSVVSLCLQNMQLFIDVSSKVQPQDFLDPNNRAIYTALCSLSALGVEVFDLSIVASALNDLGMLERAGGYDYLDALFMSNVSSENLNIYVSQVLDASLMYRLEGTLNNSAAFVRSKGNSSEVSAESVLTLVEESILSLGLDTLKISDGNNIGDGVLELLTEYEANPSTVRGLQSGFTILDRILNGFVKGGLYVVAARPKIGKSMLLTNWAAYMCRTQGVPILYIDTEMTFKEDYQPRFLSHLSGVPERIIKNGLHKQDAKQNEAVYWAAKFMQDMKFVHKYMPGFRMDDVRSMVRKYHARDGIGALFFDYVKMVELNENFNETQTLGYITSSLKDLAGTLGIPVITAVQLNRTGDGKSRISSDQIADSDRVLRYCNVLMALAPKSAKEIRDDGIVCGTHRLQILDNRGGSSFYSGIDLLAKRPIIKIEEAVEQSSDSIKEQREVEDEKVI